MQCGQACLTVELHYNTPEEALPPTKMRFNISKDNPALYLTIVTKDRLPIFRTTSLANVICIQSCVFLDLFRLFAMMRKSVKRSSDMAFGINPLASVNAKLEGDYPSELGLKSQNLKIKHQLHMIVEGIRDTGRHVRIVAS